MNFADLGLSPEVLNAVEDSGYDTPTPIQEKAIPYVLMGRDVLGTAQTGTGKTASFTLPMIDILASGQAKARMPRSLILEPTRELAAQVADNFEKYGKYSNLSMALLIGGVSFSDQEAKLDKGVDVLIATPGRLLDHFERGKVLLNGVKTLVIDEADRMMDMGFIPDVERIVSLMPPLRQTLFFSATMSKEMRKLADKFLQNPKEVAVAPPTSTAATVTQGMVTVGKMEKRPALRKMLAHEDVKTAFIFCNRKKDVDILLGSLIKHGFNAGALHGDMSQSHRMETLDKFKNGEISLLVCSDVAARGIDVNSVSHVFNFDVPFHAEDYIHRIGRTGRAGQEGHAYTLTTRSDDKFLDAIYKLIGREIPPIKIDGMEDIAAEAAEIAEREKRISGKDKSAGRGGRGRSERGGRSRSRAPKEAREEAEVNEAPREKESAKAPSNDDVKSSKKPQKAAPKPRRGRHDRDDDDAPVVGLGENVPAFFKIPFKKTASK
ncbi:MAG: DEAD/DEAH box helicase [Alphaproteobacteria bacterium]|nr:MAG: DEAD/DEAH box helicase [Alphaproteobacteria bacterium]